MSEDEITKEKILGACQERFTREGFSRIPVDEIVTDLAMSKKTFYKYFKNKEDVVQQIMDRLRGNVRGQAERILTSDKSAVEKLDEFITMIGMATGKLAPAFGQDIKKHIPALWKQMEEFRRQRISDVVTRLITQGVDEGTMRLEMNKRVFLMCVLSAIDRIMQPHVLAEESFSVSEALKEIVSIFFLGTLTARGREQFDTIHRTQPT